LDKVYNLKVVFINYLILDNKKLCVKEDGPWFFWRGILSASKYISSGFCQNPIQRNGKVNYPFLKNNLHRNRKTWQRAVIAFYCHFVFSIRVSNLFPKMPTLMLRGAQHHKKVQFSFLNVSCFLPKIIEGLEKNVWFLCFFFLNISVCKL